MTQCFMSAKFAVEQFYLKHNSWADSKQSNLIVRKDLLDEK